MTYAQAGRPSARKPGAPGDSFATWLCRLRWSVVVAWTPTVVMPIARHPAATALALIVALGAACAGLASLRIDNNPVNNVKGNPGSVVGQHLLAANFPAGASNPLILLAPPRQA